MIGLIALAIGIWGVAAGPPELRVFAIAFIVMGSFLTIALVKE